MAALTQKELEAEVAEWREHRAALGFDVDTPAAKELKFGSFTKAAPVIPKVLITGILKAIAPTIHALETQVSKLQARIEELERKGYCGVWKAGKEYSAQSEVTHDGARWIAHKRTSDKPGSSADWTMIEKAESVPTPRHTGAAARPRS
jgi:hypothetical protein